MFYCRRATHAGPSLLFFILFVTLGTYPKSVVLYIVRPHFISGKSSYDSAAVSFYGN
jgi:hypothetical protein